MYKIKSSKIKEIVLRARASERKDQEKIWKERLNTEIGLISSKHEAELSEKDGIISNLYLRLEAMQKEVDKAIEARVICLQKIKEAEKLKHDLEYNADKITKAIGEIESASRNSVKTANKEVDMLKDAVNSSTTKLTLAK